MTADNPIPTENPDRTQPMHVPGQIRPGDTPPGIAGEPPPARRRKHTTGIAITVAVFTSVIALASLALATYEWGRASTANKAAAAATAATAQAVSAPTTPVAPATTALDDTAGPDNTTPTATPTDIDPSASFTPAYAVQQQLQLHTPDYGSLNVDLDEPRVNVGSDVTDLIIEHHSQPTDFTFNNSTAAVASSAAVTPNDCAHLIQTGSLPSGTSVPVTKGLVLCVVTNLSAAQAQGTSRKVAVVEVKGIAADGTVDVVVSAWSVPN
jgi:hypothetical protein